MRTRYTMINMLVNIGGQFFAMLLSFINRMVFIRCLSAAYLGVNGLFTDVLSILNFAELGIGTAMVFSMYEPAARDDEQSRCCCSGWYCCHFYRTLSRAERKLSISP